MFYISKLYKLTLTFLLTYLLTNNQSNKQIQFVITFSYSHNQHELPNNVKYCKVSATTSNILQTLPTSHIFKQYAVSVNMLRYQHLWSHYHMALYRHYQNIPGTDATEYIHVMKTLWQCCSQLYAMWNSDRERNAGIKSPCKTPSHGLSLTELCRCNVCYL